jgi:hypothetical protein
MGRSPYWTDRYGGYMIKTDYKQENNDKNVKITTESIKMTTESNMNDKLNFTLETLLILVVDFVLPVALFLLILR